MISLWITRLDVTNSAEVSWLWAERKCGMRVKNPKGFAVGKTHPRLDLKEGETISDATPSTAFSRR
jgi:hypothetical protein